MFYVNLTLIKLLTHLLSQKLSSILLLFRLFSVIFGNLIFFYVKGHQHCVLDKKLSCRREAATSTSLEILLSHSKWPRIIRNFTVE